MEFKITSVDANKIFPVEGTALYIRVGLYS